MRKRILYMSQYVESEKVELKAKYTDTICKELVAFLNANGGQIIIGVDNNGNVIGVDKIDETLKRISHIITMQIEPNPQEEIRTELKFDSGKTLIVLFILKGTRNIYCQKKYGFSSNEHLVQTFLLENLKYIIRKMAFMLRIPQ